MAGFLCADPCLWYQHSWQLWPEVRKADLSLPEGKEWLLCQHWELFIFSCEGFALHVLSRWVPAVPGSNSQLDPWFCAHSSVLTLSLWSFCSVTCTSSTAQPGRWRHLCSFSVSVHATSTCMDYGTSGKSPSTSEWLLFLLTRSWQGSSWRSSLTVAYEKNLGVCYSVFTTFFFFLHSPGQKQLRVFFNHPWQWFLQGEQFQATWDRQGAVIVSNTQQGVQLYLTWQW